MDHPIHIHPLAERVVVRWRGQTVVDTRAAVELKEASYPGVIYVPRADADMRFFERTSRETTCPYKGKAYYFSLRAGDALDANIVWTYEAPKAGVEAIAGHLAFYPDKVEIQREAV